MAEVGRLSAIPNTITKRDQAATKLWLLSMTVDRATSFAKVAEVEGYSSPPSPNSKADKLQHSSPTKDTVFMMDEWKKNRRREQCRINQANYRKRQRMYASAGTLKLSSSLNAEQAAALKMALEACSYSATRAREKKVKTESTPPPPPPPTERDLITEDVKKARRREQCRINQANYRKRQRENKPVLIGEIDALERDIQRLESFKAKSGGQIAKTNSLKAISDFYHGLGLPVEQQPFCLADVQRYQQTYGCSPGLQLLADLQREEFDSIESLKLHWRWYRTQFRAFQFSIKTCKRFELSEHTLVKVTGELRLDIYANGKAGHGSVVCPVLHQFEFEKGDQGMRRITSEVDLLAGIAAIPHYSRPQRALTALHHLSEAFCISNRESR